MTNEQKSAIANLRGKGCGYKKIGQMLGINENTVKTYCKRHGLAGIAVSAVPLAEEHCKGCGIPIIQSPGRRKKDFCSDFCRNRWWNTHLDLVERKAFYSFTCPECGRTFESYGNNRRKYCSRACANAARRNRDGR